MDSPRLFTWLFVGLDLKASYLLLTYSEYSSYTIKEKRSLVNLQYFYFTDRIVSIYSSRSLTAYFWVMPKLLNTISYPSILFSFPTHMWLMRISDSAKRVKVKNSPNFKNPDFVNMEGESKVR